MPPALGAPAKTGKETHLPQCREARGDGHPLPHTDRDTVHTASREPRHRPHFPEARATTPASFLRAVLVHRRDYVSNRFWAFIPNIFSKGLCHQRDSQVWGDTSRNKSPLQGRRDLHKRSCKKCSETGFEPTVPDRTGKAWPGAVPGP